MPRIIPDVLKNLFSKPATLKYPKEKREPPEGYRGKPEVDMDKCVSCGVCAKVCPAWAITYDDDDLPVFDLGKCVYCGECADNCPTDAIEMVRDYEFAVFDKSDLKTG